MQNNKNYKQLETPILFIVYKRYYEALKVFKEIKKQRPKHLYVVSDGPKNEKDKEKVDKVRSLINQVDWPCELRTWYRNENWGGKEGTPAGIRWFFSCVNEGIILEDDCVPESTFFKYCETLLNEYRYDKRIAIISGTNFAENVTINSYYDYHFASYARCWGWATWRDRWFNFDFALNGSDYYVKYNNFVTRFARKKDRKFWKERLKLMKNYIENRKENMLGWDRKLVMSAHMNSQLFIIPKYNQVSNIGYGEESYNMQIKRKYHCLRTKKLNFPLKKPSCIAVNEALDKYQENYKHSGTVMKRIAGNVSKITPEFAKKIYRKYLINKIKID